MTIAGTSWIKCVVLQRRYQTGEVHTARYVTLEDGVADMPAPHRQSLALALFQVTAPHDRPSRGAGKHPPAGFHLVVDVDDAS